MSEDIETKEVQKVPLPFEKPKAFDYSTLPTHILRSSAVESLITQNDDLMARLTVSLRRISLLEENLNTHTQSHEKLKFYFENLKDQILILKEKEKSFNDRKNSLEIQHNQRKEALKILELRYEELLSVREKEKKTFNTTLDQVSKRLNRYLKYRKRVKVAQGKRKKALQDSVGDKREILLKLAEEQASKKGLRLKVSEQAELLLTKDKMLKNSLNELTESYEKKLSHLDKALKEKEKLVSSLREKSKDFEKVYRENVELQNKAIFEKRKKEELESGLMAEIASLKKDLSHYRVEFRKFKSQSESSKLALDQNKALLKNEKEEREGLLAQLENLQILWKEGEEKMEKQKEQIEALQKLNKKLSLDLNESRKKLRELKEVSQLS